MFKEYIQIFFTWKFRPAILYYYFYNSQLTKMLYLFNYLAIIIEMQKPNKTYWLRQRLERWLIKNIGSCKTEVHFPAPMWQLCNSRYNIYCGLCRYCTYMENNKTM